MVLVIWMAAALGCGDSDAVFRETGEGPPVVMTQMLQFREVAEGVDEVLSGRDAYLRYSEPLQRVAEEFGGRLVWTGSTGPLIIGQSEGDFDEIVSIEYPSHRVFRQVVQDPRVTENAAYRQAGLECQWLIPGVPEDAIPNDAFSGGRDRTGALLETAQADDPVPDCPAPAALDLYPSLQGLLGLLRRPNDVPVVMINLLRFKEWTEELGEGMTGFEAYGLYGEGVLPLVQSYGCRMIWTGRVEAPSGQRGNGDFHAIALLEYPSDLVFLQVVRDPRMAEIGGYRAAGLEGQWLIPGRTYD
jgi:uncharacterized protein (DUF1330 family)